MHQDVTSLKPLFLSEEETMALLDLCLTSSSEIDDVKEQAVRKLTELARRHLRANIPNTITIHTINIRSAMGCRV